MKKHIELLIPLFLGLLVILPLACRDSSNTENKVEKESFGNFKVALLMPGSADDRGWNVMGRQGLELVKKDLGATVAYSENVSDDQIEKEFEKYAREGFDLIIGHGGQFVKGAETVAMKYPRINFMIVGTHPGNNSNLGAVQFRQEQIGYLAGAVAGLKTKTNKVAYVMGMDYTHMKKKAAFFQRGALAVNPEVTFKAIRLGSWNDREKGSQCGKQLIDEGFDVIAVDADSAGIPIHEIAQQAGVHTIGWTTDQYSIAPRAIITSAIQGTDILILEGARQARLGRWEGKQYKYGINDGVQDLAPFRNSLSPEEKDKIKKIRSDIQAEKLDLIFAGKIEILECAP